MTLITAERVNRAGEVSVPAVRDVSFSVEDGSPTAFVGPSGSGKATLLNMVGCLDRPDEATLVVLLALALHNLCRHRRRTVLTALPITTGVLALLVFVSVTSSFKGEMVGNITDSMLGHMQVHRRGWLASIESLPLQRQMQPRVMQQLEATPGIAVWSPRVKLGGRYSDFEQTTSVGLNGALPEREMATCPRLVERILEGERVPLKRGQIWLPERLARGMKARGGDTGVVVATNLEGAVDGMVFEVAAILKSVTGPGDRDAYLHLEDARELLQIESPEVSEVAIRVDRFDRLPGTPEARYTGYEDWELRVRASALVGANGSEFGENAGRCRFGVRGLSSSRVPRAGARAPICRPAHDSAVPSLRLCSAALPPGHCRRSRTGPGICACPRASRPPPARPPACP